VRLHVRQAALNQDRGVISDDRIDAGGLVQGQNYTREQERQHVFAVEQALGHAPSRRFNELRRLVTFHFFDFQACLFGVTRTQKRVERALLLAAAEEPTRGFHYRKTAQHKEQSRRQ